MKYTATNANKIASIHENMVYRVALACGFFAFCFPSSVFRFLFSTSSGLYFFHQLQGIYLVVKISITIGSKTSQPRLAQSPHATHITKAIYIVLHTPQAIHPLALTSFILSLKLFIFHIKFKKSRKGTKKRAHTQVKARFFCLLQFYFNGAA